MIRLSELLTDYMYEEDSEAAKQAKQQGLIYKGFGRWADPKTGQITHKTDSGRLVPVSQDQPSGPGPAPSGPRTPDQSPSIDPDPRGPGERPTPEPEDDFETDTPDWHNMDTGQIDDYLTDLANKGELEQAKWALEDPDLHDRLAQSIRQRDAERGYNSSDDEIEDYVYDKLEQRWEDLKKIAKAGELAKKRKKKSYMDYEPEPGIGGAGSMGDRGIARGAPEFRGMGRDVGYQDDPYDL